MRVYSQKLLMLCSTGALGAMAASGAIAQDTGSQEEKPEHSEPEAEQPDGTEIVCRYVRETGTRFKTRVCQTRDQWRGTDSDNRESAAQARRDQT